MATTRRPIVINGKTQWITSKTAQEFADKVLVLAATPKSSEKHPFESYAWNWFETYSKPNIETVTATTYKRQLTKHILPAFNGLNVEEISVDHVQTLFNSMSGRKTTKDKARIVLNQILDAAVEDKLLPTNPLKSKRIKITGEQSNPTNPYSTEQMRYLVSHIGDVKNAADRGFLAILSLHPLRLEEVLGLQGSDIDAEGMTLYINRAVTHPTRNQPEVKETKTEHSRRPVGIAPIALQYLPSVPKDKFLFGSDKPLSYTQVRRMCERIRKDTGFEEKITPIRFRTTVLTDLYDKTKDIKLTQEAAGHTTSAMTMKYYVKGRESQAAAANAIQEAYSMS